MAEKPGASNGCLEVRNNVFRHITIIFMGLCLGLCSVLAITQPLPFAENELLMRIWMGYLGLPVSITLVAFNVWRIVSRPYAIIINDAGITDYTTALSSGFTPWDEISSVFLLRLKSDDFLCALPADYEKWLEERTPRARKLATANVESGFAPIRIQFKKASDTVTAQDGLKAVRQLKPQLVTKTRKPRY